MIYLGIIGYIIFGLILSSSFWWSEIKGEVLDDNPFGAGLNFIIMLACAAVWPILVVSVVMSVIIIGVGKILQAVIG